MKHLIVSATEVAAGELTHAARLARALLAAGDEVVVLLPRALDGIVADLGVRRGYIDDALPVLDRAVLAAIERERPDAIVLADGMAVAQAMEMRGLPFTPFIAAARAGTRVIAMDMWNLDETGLVVDYGADTFALPDVLRDLPRLVPVPFARPTTPNGYCALPAAAARDTTTGGDPRTVLWPIAAWQLPEMQLHPERARIAERVIAQCAAAFAQLGVRVVLVGPSAPRALEVLGGRVEHAGVVPAARYAQLLASADLLFGVNIAATSLLSAIAAGLPALVALDREFLVCPIGMTRFLAPALVDNPFTTAIATATVSALAPAIDALLADSSALRARQAAYATAVRALPSAADVYRRLLAD